MRQHRTPYATIFLIVMEILLTFFHPHRSSMARTIQQVYACSPVHKQNHIKQLKSYDII